MENTSSSLSKIHLLPPEILVYIFRYLSDKDDKRNCLSVCRLWYQVMFDVSSGIPIVVFCHNIDNLLIDLSEYPLFGPKVTAIDLYKHWNIPLVHDAQHYALVLKFVLRHCPNLRRLHINVTSGVPVVAEDLDSPKALLPCIEDIDFVGLRLPTRIQRNSFLRLHYQHRETITILKIHDLQNNGMLKECGGLYNLISCFPDLRSLTISPRLVRANPVEHHSIDLKLLLLSALKLKELDVDVNVRNVKDIIRIHTKEATNTNDQDSKVFNNLKRLVLKVDNADYKTLEFIMSGLNSLDSICIKLLEHDEPNFSLHDAATIKKFNKYYKSIKSHCCCLQPGQNHLESFMAMLGEEL